MAAIVVGLVLVTPGAVSAHGLDSSSIVVTIDDDAVSATVTVAVETLGEARDDPDVAEHLDEVVGYVDEHLSIESVDGTVWGETYSEPVLETIEGIESVTVDVAFATAGSDTSEFTIAYDAVIEAIPDHQAVVVLIDSAEEISTPGIIDAADPDLVITDTQQAVPIVDMVRFGFEHVLEGADHLLFLLTLLLPAPLVVTADHWRRGPGAVRTLRNVVHVVTAFTIGHSITLIASTLGWVAVPSRPVEILIAASVGVSAIHAIRPLARHGEVIIAVAFGLVHGLAFAGILADLGLEGTTSLLALLAFNVGVELAQILTTILVFPSLYTMSRTRWYPTIRIAGASIALTAATGWALDRVGLLTNPFAAAETTIIAHPSFVVIGIATMAAGTWILERSRPIPATVPIVVSDERPAECSPRCATRPDRANARTW